MRTPKLLLLAGLSAVLALSGCVNPTSADGRGGSSVLTSLGPIVAEVAQARIAQRMLDRHPDREASLLAIAAALDTIANEAAGTEITEVVIRAFVVRSTEKWQLTAPEQELLILGLVAAKDAALGSSGLSVIKIGDAQAVVWIAAVRRGILAGVESHRLAKA